MSKKILLADDSITIQKVISITFASEDYDLIIVGDGDTAVAKIKETKPDIVIADIAMPGKNGYEVCELIKKEPGLRHIPVLLLSGTFEPLNEKEAQRVKADDHVVKPFESQELIEKVKNLLAKPPAMAPVEVEAGKTVIIQAKAPMPIDIWEVGDFMGVEETEAPAKGAAASAEKEIWEVDFFEEPAKVISVKPEEKPKIEDEFIELDLKEEELQPVEEVKPVPPSALKPKEAIGFEAAPEIKPQPPVKPSVPPMIPTPPAAPKAVSTVPERIEAKIKEAVKEEAVELSGVPKEQLEEVVKKISREVIEDIVWEIIPDLAEEIIREELRKVREAIGKLK